MNYSFLSKKNGCKNSEKIKGRTGNEKKFFLWQKYHPYSSKKRAIMKVFLWVGHKPLCVCLFILPNNLQHIIVELLIINFFFVGV